METLLVPSPGAVMEAQGSAEWSLTQKTFCPCLTSRSTEATMRLYPNLPSGPAGLQNQEPLPAHLWLEVPGPTPHLRKRLAGMQPWVGVGARCLLPGICPVTSWTSGPRLASPG